MNLTIRLTMFEASAHTYYRQLLAVPNIYNIEVHQGRDNDPAADKGDPIRAQVEKVVMVASNRSFIFYLGSRLAINGSSCRASRKMPNCTMPEIITRQLRKLGKGLKPFPRRAKLQGRVCVAKIC